MIKNKPEAYGISSDNLLCMVQELETFVEDIHSISVVCDNDVIFSKCIQPYTEEPMQMLHSFSKSMNSIAVGIAIDEGKLHLDDLVIDYFKEYLPEEYLKEATRKQIDTPEEKYPVCGYGYQYWITADHSFGVYGAFGNVIVVNPEKKLAVAITAGASDKNGNPNRLISKIVNEKLFIPTERGTLKTDVDGEKKLKKYLDDLCLPYPEGAKNSCLEGKWFDKTLSFEENDRKIQSIEINRKTENELLINFHLKDRMVSVEAGFENWITQEAVFDDPHHFLNSFSYAFKDDKTLVIKQYWLNMSGYDIYTLHFQDDSVNGMIITSVKLGGAVPIELSGNIQ